MSSLPLYFLVIKYFASSWAVWVEENVPLILLGQLKFWSSCCSGFIKLIKSFLCTGSLRIKSNTNGLGVPLIVIVLTPTALEDEVVDNLNLVSPSESHT